MPLDVGQDLVISLPPFENTGSKPLVIDSARLLIDTHSPQRIVVKQQLIGLPDRVNNGGALRGKLDLKSEGPWEPVAGASIEPTSEADNNGKQGYSFIFVVDVNGIGNAWADGVHVQYHVGKRHYAATSNDLFVVCTPLTWHPMTATT